ncbi:MAG: cysteine desulfurase family protein, partial [Candidatus Micrarchaeota archaeon]
MKKIYMDHAATSAVSNEVLEAMKPYFGARFGNASSLHSFGREANEALENARGVVASVIGAEKSEIIFTSGGSEADNLALVGAARVNRKKGKHIITSAIEHPAVLNACAHLEKEGFEVTYVGVSRDGLVNVEDVKKTVRADTILISVMHANNEIGTIQPIEEIGKFARERGIVFHSDAVQTLGKIPIDVKKMNVDLMSFSSHKLHGPKGVGALYVRKGVKLEPLIYGGNHEKGMRAGTENVAGIVGFAKAAEIAQKELPKEMKRIANLRDELIKGALKIKGARLHGSLEKRLPGNINVGFPDI